MKKITGKHSLLTLAVLQVLMACSMASSNQQNVPFDANNKYCQLLWQDIHNHELGRTQTSKITNHTGQRKDLSQLDIEKNHQMMQYERDCELPANFNERKAASEKISVK